MPEPFEIITGVGRLYLAEVGASFPAITEDVPSAEVWRDMGDTQDGVTVTLDETINVIVTDQSHGPVKSSRSEETLVVATNFAHATLENLADILGTGPVTEDTENDTKSIGLYRGQTVQTHAFLFRGNSAYGEGKSQYEIPVGYFAGAVELQDTRDGNRRISAEFHAMVDPNAATEHEKFGRLIMDTSEPIPPEA